MTGRYSLRTGVHDTYNGGAIMAANEVTIAEILKGKGYRTGIFGKWHLGDSYPCRPTDQGFDESIVHLGGGMGQPGILRLSLKATAVISIRSYGITGNSNLIKAIAPTSLQEQQLIS